ncbi:hypothetical protein N9219_01660 [bacterium]|nr:hypothetical protein [bacterium]
MLFFAAENFHLMANFKAEEAMARMMLSVFKSYPRLVSFAYPDEAETVYQLKSLPDIKDRVIVMTDSGAYSVLKKKAKINLEDYIQYLQDNWDVIDHAISLDRISDGKKSYDNYMAMRSEGLPVVPVYHLGTDLNYLYAYLDMADYVGISLHKDTDPKKQIPELDDLWEYHLTDRDRFPIARCHLFGVSSVPVISRYAWYSFDNTAWWRVPGYGGLYLAESDNGIPDYNVIPTSLPVSSGSSHKSNYLQNQSGDSRRYYQARITSAALQFELNHDLDDHMTRYAISLAHYYKVADRQQDWRRPFERRENIYG